MLKIVLLVSFIGVSLYADSAKVQQERQRASKLSAYLKKEKKQFKNRERRKKTLLDELDRINLAQNHLRTELEVLRQEKEEMEMVLDNFSLEVLNETKKVEKTQASLSQMLRILYRVHRDGALQVIFSGNDFARSMRKMKMVFRATRQSSKMLKEIQDRESRLRLAAQRLQSASEELDQLIDASKSKEVSLSSLIKKKRGLLKGIQNRQQAYHVAKQQHSEISERIKRLLATRLPKKSDRPLKLKLANPLLPVEFGKLVKSYGRQKRGREFYKGVLIEAPHSSPVYAISPGTVEFEGWIRGLGNVVIVHHGNGTYSLNGHLHQSSIHKGAVVKKGEIIGLVGDTGRSEKAALYFELRKRTATVDPKRYFKKSIWDKIS